jgi:hypothetical protein
MSPGPPEGGRILVQKKTQIASADHRLIMAWVRGEREDLSLTTRAVLDRYTPPDIKGSAQYFTSPETGMAVLEPLRLWLPASQKLWVLEPCAGIGHLIYLLRDLRQHLVVDAYEVEAECVQVGRKLFPWANWQANMPFLAMDAIEGRYDLVLCNPPIGIRQGMALARPVCQGRCGRSEHVFLEISIRALKPGGQAVILGPENFLDKWPARLRTWLADQVEPVDCFGPLPGGRANSIQLYAHYFRKVGGATLARGQRGREVSLKSIHFEKLSQ